MPPPNQQDKPPNGDHISNNTVINLSDFVLHERHIKLLKRGLSFSPMNTMNDFVVYKDICLFFRKVYLRQVHQDLDTLNPEAGMNTTQDREKSIL